MSSVYIHSHHVLLFALALRQPVSTEFMHALVLTSFQLLWIVSAIVYGLFLPSVHSYIIASRNITLYHPLLDFYCNVISHRILFAHIFFVVIESLGSLLCIYQNARMPYVLSYTSII